MILNIHTHTLAPDTEAIIDISSHIREADSFSIPSDYPDTQLFSAGFHPWWLSDEPADTILDKIEAAAANPRIALIGESGIDIPKGGPLFRQMNIFRKMIEISEKNRKPLLIHDVKAHEIILGLHKEMRPTQPWIIHGFRYKPSVAEMFIRQGFYISFGPLFNPLSLPVVPLDRILAETDESSVPVREVIDALSDARGVDLTRTIGQNSANLLTPSSLNS